MLFGFSRFSIGYLKVNTEPENTVVVAMAEKALALDGNIERDYWMGGVKDENGTWVWQSGGF